MEDEILSKEPWPARGIDSYQSIEDGPWGYLVNYKTKGFVFEWNETPTTDEIMARWGSRLK